MKNTVLLTGGFGNLGGRLSSYLHKQQKFNIRLGSRVARNVPPWAPDAETTRLDVLEMDSLNTSLSDVDIVIHLAAMNDAECASDPKLARLVNVEGTRNLLECAVAADVRKIVYLSTAHVYAAPLVGTINESTIPKPRHPYSITSLEAEKLIKKVHDENEIVGFRVRCANGFGAPMDPLVNIWQILIDDLCRQAVELGILTLKSHGIQERNFVPLQDVCAGIFHLINLDQQYVGDGLFNLGHKDSTSVWNMAQRIAARCEAVLGFTPPINRPPAEPNEQPQTLDYRSDKLRATGFVPSGDLDAEIDDLLRFCAKEFPHRS
jgi:UDP-glucose 4-epimerase